MTKYKTLKATTFPELMAKIKKSIKGGWHIYGGGLTKGFLKPVYTQEMIKG